MDDIPIAHVSLDNMGGAEAAYVVLPSVSGDFCFFSLWCCWSLHISPAEEPLCPGALFVACRLPAYGARAADISYTVDDEDDMPAGGCCLVVVQSGVKGVTAGRALTFDCLVGCLRGAGWCTSPRRLRV